MPWTVGGVFGLSILFTIIAKWWIETMVLPELSRTMAYTTHNTVNRIAHNDLNLNPVVLELSKDKETYISGSRNISSIR